MVSEAAVQLAIQARLAVRYRRAMKKEIQRAMLAAADLYEEAGDIGIDLTAFKHRDNVQHILDGLWGQSIKTFSSRTKGREQKSLVSDLVRKWMAEKAIKSLQRIPMTTLLMVRTVIMKGRSEGEGSGAIAKRIKKIAPSISLARADLITRTETHGSANFANIETVKSIGAHTKKEWIPVSDERTRTGTFDHRDAEQVVGIEEKFFVSDEYLDYPGDNSGSPGNIINCRCIMGYVR